MRFFQKFDRIITGIVSGLILPFLIGLAVYIFSAGGQSIHSFISKIADSNIITHSITLCVFPNVIIFLLFNRFDMLRASRGVLSITIVWAIVVFGIKFLG